MKRFAVISIACSACWGAGPTPTSPSNAEIIFKVPPTYNVEFCGSNDRYPYVGDVAFGGAFAYVTEMQFQPPQNNCDGNSGGGDMTPKPVPVHRIALDSGGGPSFTAGTSNGTITTRVLGTPSHGGWVHAPNDGTRLEVRGIDGPPEANLPYNGGFYLPVGLAGDDAHAFVIATTGAPSSNQDVNSPRYPCCSNTGGNNPSSPASAGWKVPWDDTSGPVQISLPTEMYVINDSLKSGVVANSTTVFYAMRDRAQTTLDADLRSMPMTDTTDFTIRAQVPAFLGVPVGLAANDEVLAWATAPSYAKLPVPDPQCKLFLLDLQNPAEVREPHFASSDFSCQDLAVDDTHAYFMIIKVEPDDHSDNNPSDMRGIGIGRVSLTSPPVLESITIGDGSSRFSGPRRIYLNGDDPYLYLVEPFAIARVSKTALDGKADF